MTKLTQEQEAGFEDIYDTEITDEDYGFIFGPDGELKSVFLPDHMPFKCPKKIARILKIFGINDPEQLNNTTLH